MNYQWLCVLLIVVQPAFCLKSDQKNPELISTVDSSFTLTCFDLENITWTYPQDGDSIKTRNYYQKNGEHVLTLNVSNTSYLDTGNYVCENLNRKNITNNSAEIYVYIFDREHHLAVKDDYTVIQSSENKSIIIPCKPTSPNVTVKLWNTEDESEMHLDYDPKTGFLLKSPKVKDSKTLRCEGSSNSSEYVDEKVFHLMINPTDPSAKPFISSSGAGIAVEGKPFSFNCSVRLKIGAVVFVNWKYPNEGVKNRSKELDQEEFFFPDGKLNYKVLTIFNLSKSDTGNYTCEVEDKHTNNVANFSYYLNVFDPNETFLDFKLLTDATNHTLESKIEKLQWMFNVTSYPPATVSCKVPNGQVISTVDSSPSNKYQLSLFDKLAKFVIYQLEVNDTGIYEFKADNGRQNITLAIQIRIKGN